MEKILVATAITAGAAALVWLLKRNKNRLNLPAPQSQSLQSRHLTDVFAKAKPSRDQHDQW